MITRKGYVVFHLLRTTRRHNQGGNFMKLILSFHRSDLRLLQFCIFVHATRGGTRNHRGFRRTRRFNQIQLLISPMSRERVYLHRVVNSHFVHARRREFSRTLTSATVLRVSIRQITIFIRSSFHFVKFRVSNPTFLAFFRGNFVRCYRVFRRQRGVTMFVA